jgi:D-sedoheptulose 7-phosphate isomerase
MENVVDACLLDSINLKNEILENQELKLVIICAASEITKAYEAGNKTRFCGNGGSAADAQHISAELSGKFYFNRPPLDSEALHVNGSFVTAVANDYSFDVVYERMIEAQGKPGDVFVGISTSGNSVNVVSAIKKAREIGMITVAFTGEDGGDMANHADYIIAVPSNDTPRIQETHILIGHIICQIVEQELFGDLKKQKV